VLNNGSTLVQKDKLKHQVESAISDICNCFRAYYPTPLRESSIVLAAYLLSILGNEENIAAISFQDVVDGKLFDDDHISLLAKTTMNEMIWGNLKEMVAKYTPEVLALAAATPDRNAQNTTPESIIELAIAVMEIQTGFLVADIGCGSGAFLLDAVTSQPSAHYIGYEISTEEKAIAAIRASLTGKNINIHQCDAFILADETAADYLPTRRFDRVFSNYPFGMRLRNLNNGTGVQKLIDKYPSLSKATSADWLFNALLCELITPSGKAIGIMTNGSTWNITDTAIRKHFMENGLIEAVISLPERLFNSTSISTSMIVLSHGNKKIRLVDATKLYQKGRRINTLTADSIKTIMHALNVDSEYSKLIDIEEFRSNDYVLNPGRYLGEGINIENGVPFETAIKNISRGAPCTASQLDAMVSNSPTNMQYLMLANIQNGVIDSDLPYLASIDPKYEKYCLHNGNLIISKNGFPYKVAVASVKEGQSILANGNLYIIELDEGRADPYYVKAFFESERGIAQLSSITVGAALPNIGVDKLKKMIIPLPDLQEQKRIAKRYLAAQDEVSVLKRKLEKAQSRLIHIFDTESEE